MREGRIIKDGRLPKFDIQFPLSPMKKSICRYFLNNILIIRRGRIILCIPSHIAFRTSKSNNWIIPCNSKYQFPTGCRRDAFTIRKAACYSLPFLALIKWLFFVFLAIFKIIVVGSVIRKLPSGFPMVPELGGIILIGYNGRRMEG